MEFKNSDGLDLENHLDRLVKLEAENARLKEVIKDNGLEDEINDIDCTSVEEKVCIEGINHIARKVNLDDFSKDDIASFNTLYNILRSIKGKSPAGTKKPQGEVRDLLQVINGSKK